MGRILPGKCEFILIGSFWIGAGALLARERLNALFIAGYDLRTQSGSYGDSIAITPHTDKLAQHGMVFSTAYCQPEVWNLSWTSLMTGCRPNTTKVRDLENSFSECFTGCYYPIAEIKFKLKQYRSFNAMCNKKVDL